MKKSDSESWLFFSLHCFIFFPLFLLLLVALVKPVNCSNYYHYCYFARYYYFTATECYAAFFSCSSIILYYSAANQPTRPRNGDAGQKWKNSEILTRSVPVFPVSGLNFFVFWFLRVKWKFVTYRNVTRSHLSLQFFMLTLCFSVLFATGAYLASDAFMRDKFASFVLVAWIMRFVREIFCSLHKKWDAAQKRQRIELESMSFTIEILIANDKPFFYTKIF